MEEDFDFNRLHNVKVIPFYNIISLNISDDSFFFVVKMPKNQTFILLKSNSQISYGKLDQEGKINEMKFLDNNNYLSKEMNIVSYQDFILIPNQFQGLLCYKLANDNFSLDNEFFNNNFNPFDEYNEINDISLHPKHPDILIISDKINGIFYTKITLENGTMNLGPKNYILQQASFTFISVSLAYNISTLGALLSNSSSKEYYYEINIETLPSIKIRKIIPLYLQHASIILTNEFSLVKTVNMISIIKIGLSKNVTQIGLPFLENTIYFKFSNYNYFLFNKKYFIGLSRIIKTEPRISLNYKNSIKEIVNITGISNECLNFSLHHRNIYYNEFNSCNYTLPILVTVTLLTKDGIKSTFQYWVILILLPILGIGGAIFYIYYQKYRKVKGDYDFLVNQSQIKTTPNDLVANSPSPKVKEGPFKPAIYAGEIFKIHDDNNEKKEPNIGSNDLKIPVQNENEVRKTIDPMVSNQISEAKKDPY